MSSEADQASSEQRRAIIFESYGWDDAREIANRIKATLQEAGYDVWIDRERIRHDERDFWRPLEMALEESELVVALLSPYSGRLDNDVARNPWMSICHNELIMARNMNKTVVPITVIDCKPPLAIVHYDPIDFTNWHSSPETYRAGTEEILHWIREGLSRPPRRRYSNYVDNLSGDRLSFPEELIAKDNFVGREWIIGRLEAWAEREAEKCFLIEAESGTGKTALVAELVRRNDQDRILAYHFCNSQNEDTTDPRRFVRSIAAMLCGTVPEYRTRLRNGDLVSALKIENNPTTMLWQGVLAPLDQVPMERVHYIIVDALDEAAGRANMSIPELLSRELFHFPPWLKLVVTTRRDDRVPGFRSAKRCRLAESEAQQRDDLRLFIEQRLTEPDLRSRIADEEMRRRAVADIDERSIGNFQYAAMVLEELRRGALDIGEIDRLPGSLADLYENRTRARFPAPTDFDAARRILSVLLAARQPLTLEQLALVTGLDQSGELSDTLNKLSYFVTWDTGPKDEHYYRVAHKSFGDWLTAPPGGSPRFRVDLVLGHELILAHCRKWESNHEPYALTHLIGHLLEGDLRDEALMVVRNGFFDKRRADVDPRYDLDDTRSLTLALVACKDQASILELAQTANLWQRDGVASGLQAAPREDDDFVDRTVEALFRVT
jgi:TIR domain